jgi:Protein of unknown function (DUF2924)
MHVKGPFLVAERNPLDLDRLARMKPRELRQVYTEVFGSDAWVGNSEFARRRIAWRVQAEHEGGLPESARQHALAIARNSSVRVRLSANAERRVRGLPLEHAVTTNVGSDHDSRLPMPGSVIVKQHKDKRITVRVLSSGFEYDGNRFASLSAVARKITGTKWNGFLFFGLGKESRRAR